MFGLHIYKIEGRSVEPELYQGDFILTLSAIRSLKKGDVIVVRHPLYGIIVKRIAAISIDGHLWLAGIHRASVQPEQIGWVDPERVLGRRLCVIRRKSSSA